MPDTRATAITRPRASKAKKIGYRPAPMGPLERAVFRREKKRWEAARATTRFASDAPSGGERPLAATTWSRVPTADAVATKLMLAKAFDETESLALAMRCASPVVICDVPDQAVLGMVAACWKEVVLGDVAAASHSVLSDILPSIAARSATQCLHMIVADPPKESDRHRAQRGALAALSLAIPVVAFSPLAASYLPDALLRACDVRLTVGRPDADTIGKTVHLVTGSMPREVPDEGLLNEIGADEISLAVRFDRSADECMEKLRRLAASKAESASVRGLRLDDLRGMDDAVAWAKAFVKDVAAWRRREIPWSAVEAGVVFEGPPGTAKSTLLRLIAAESGTNLVIASLAKWQGSGEGHLGHLLRQMHADVARAKSSSPCVFGIDEIEAFGDRSSMTHAWRDYSRQVIDGFLAACDTLSASHDFHGDGRAVALIGTTNDASRCDPAILRSGRFNRVIRVGLPDGAALEAIFRLRLRADLADADLGDLALAALGCTGADVGRIVDEARRSARQAGRGMVLDDLKRALCGGAETPSSLLPRHAVHEAAHILVDVILNGPAGAVAIMIGSARAAASVFRFRAARLAGTYAENFVRLQVMLAGRAGERLVFGEAGWGGAGVDGSDLHEATRLAAAMVGSFGNDEANLLYLGAAREAESLLVFPEVRDAVRQELAAADRASSRILSDHREALDEIAARLLADGRVDGDAVAESLARRAGPRRPATIHTLEPKGDKR